MSFYCICLSRFGSVILPCPRIPLDNGSIGRVCGPGVATPLDVVYRIVMPSETPNSQSRHQAENRTAGSEKPAHVQDDYNSGQQAETSSNFLATFVLSSEYALAAYEFSTTYFAVVLFAMILLTALLLLYWCPSSLTVPTAGNLTAEGWHRKTQAAVDTLQDWYSVDTGLWETTNWWNAANILTMLGDYALVNSNFKTQFVDIARNTHAKAPNFKSQILKVRTPTTMNTYTYPNIPPGLKAPPPSNANEGFLNWYYDDEGWWALAWLKAYDVTEEVIYLKEAMTIFDDMAKGYDAICGGIWWNKGHEANVAITNELFLAVAAHLTNRVPKAQRDYYLKWTQRQWRWFQQSGLINPEYNINDGLDLSSCRNNNGIVWSYNQGVILGALVEADIADHDPTHGAMVLRIETAAIKKLKDKDGVIHDVCEPDCGNDGPQFKGILMRNVQATRKFLGEKLFSPFSTNIRVNAASIWARDREQAKLGLVWSGPYQDATAATQSSALDALVAAIAVEMHQLH